MHATYMEGLLLPKGEPILKFHYTKRLRMSWMLLRGYYRFSSFHDAPNCELICHFSYLLDSAFQDHSLLLPAILKCFLRLCIRGLTTHKDEKYLSIWFLLLKYISFYHGPVTHSHMLITLPRYPAVLITCQVYYLSLVLSQIATNVVI